MEQNEERDTEFTAVVFWCKEGASALFCRGKGPLKNTSDVISAAKKIAEAGSRMDKLGRTIADHVSHSPVSLQHQGARADPLVQQPR